MYIIPDELIRNIQAHLNDKGCPRTCMFFVITLSALVGVLVSFCFLKAGITSMPLRYFISLTATYIFFLFLVRLSLPYVRDTAGYFDLPNPGCSWRSSNPSANGSSSSDVGFVDAGEGTIFLLALLAIFSMIAISIWLISIAPSLFAELLIDAALSASVAGQLERNHGGHWVRITLRKTWWAYFFLLIVFCVFGAYVQYVNPKIEKFGDAISYSFRTKK